MSINDLSLSLGNEQEGSELEVYQTLVGMAGKRFKPIPADAMVRQILKVTSELDWPAKRAALEALASCQHFGDPV